MKRVWKRILPGAVGTAALCEGRAPAFRFASRPASGALVEVGDASREIRGERVLAVVGACHVIRREPALGRAFGVALALSTTGGAGLR